MEQHPDHGRAARYWSDESADRILFCRITALGLLRLCTNRHVTGGFPLAVTDAWRLFADYLALPEVSLADEPPGCESELAALVSTGPVTPRTWTDAYLAAFCLASGARLVSLDQDFQRFGGLRLLLLATD